MRHRDHFPDTSAGRDLKAIRSLFPYLWQYRGRVLLAFGLLILAKVANVSIPLLLKQIIDTLDASQNPVIILPLSLILAYGLLRLASFLFGELRDAVFAKVAQSAIRNIALKVFRHLHDLSLSFHLERKTGGVSRDIERGTRGLGFLLNFMVFNIIPTMVEIGMVIGILLFSYDVWFGLITFTSIAAYIAYTLLVTEWRMKFRRTMNEMDSRANTRAIDSLLNYETVKYFGNENYETRRYDEYMAQWEQAAIKNQTSLSALNFGQGVIIATGITLLIYLAAKQVTTGEMTLGDLVLVNAFLLQLYMPLNFLGFVYREIKHSLADLEKMFSLIEQQAEVDDKPGAPELVVTQSEIRFKQVEFGYNQNRQILFGVDFTVPAGKKVAVVGHSGAGKSTLSRLLFRFYDINGGRILIDNQDISEVTQSSLRKTIGMVPQDTVLFNDTIYYNIAYGNPDADHDEITRVAQMAHLDHFISSLPDGYDTQVGERGLKLSGGEKQRIAIARALLKKPDIMIFDEATSSLDSSSEQAILQTLREAASACTTLVIAHRLSTIIDADKILVMDQGRIIERGTHRELLAENGQYAHMWALQQQKQDNSESG